jgi:hypothetical protein
MKLDMAPAMQQLKPAPAHLEAMIGIDAASQTIGNGSSALSDQKNQRIAPAAFMRIVQMVDYQPVRSQRS